MRISYLIILGLICTRGLLAQGATDFLEKSLENQDIAHLLPPLDTLIQRAHERSNKVRFYDAEIDYWENQKKLTRARWQDYFYLEANYNYGIFDNLNSQQLAGDPNNSQVLLSTEATRYTVGASIKLPISAIFTRNKLVKSSQADIEKAEYMKEYEKDLITQEVIVRYNELITAQRVYYISNTIVETYKIQSIRADKDYESGLITLSELTRLTQMLNEAIKSRESQRAVLIQAHQNLEWITGIELRIM